MHLFDRAADQYDAGRPAQRARPLSNREVSLREHFGDLMVVIDVYSLMFLLGSPAIARRWQHSSDHHRTSGTSFGAPAFGGGRATSITPTWRLPLL